MKSHEDGWQDPEGQVAKIEMEMKWSLWSHDRGTVEEQVPTLLRHLEAMHHSVVEVTLTSRKEIRWGRLSIAGTSEWLDSPGSLDVMGTFSEGWDSVEDLLSTLDLTDDDYDALHAELPFTDDGEVGVTVDVVHAGLRSVDDLLSAVDGDEDRLIETSTQLWREVEDWALQYRTLTKDTHPR